MANILIIDDDQVLANMLLDHIGAKGHEVTVKHRLVEGLAELQETPADVVLLDAQPPGWGASGRNGGLVSVGSAKTSDDTIVKKYGESDAHIIFVSCRTIECSWGCADPCESLKGILPKPERLHVEILSACFLLGEMSKRLIFGQV